MDNNIDNKGYWENQTIVQNKDVNNNELIALLKQEFDNINKTLEVIRDGVNDIKDYAKTRDINKLNDSSVKVSNQEEIVTPTEPVAEVSVENEENILPIGDILQKPSAETSETKVEDENIVPIDLPVIDNNEGLDVTEQASVINPDSLIINDSVTEETPAMPIAEAPVQVETPAVAETPATPVMNEAPIMPVVEAPVQVETPTVAETPVAPVMNEAPIMPVAEAPVQVEKPAVAETPVAPVMNEASIMPVAEAPVQVEKPAVAETPVAPVMNEAPIMPVAEAPVQDETIDTIEVIPLTFDSAKIAPIDPSLKSAQRTEILTENQNTILKGKSVSNTNVMSLQSTAPELVNAA